MAKKKVINLNRYSVGFSINSKSENKLQKQLTESILNALESIDFKDSSMQSSGVSKSLDRVKVNKHVGELFDKAMKEVKAKAKKDFDRVYKNHPAVLYTEPKKKKISISDFEHGDVIHDGMFYWIFFLYGGELKLYPFDKYNNGKLSEGNCSFIHDPKTWDLNLVTKGFNLFHD